METKKILLGSLLVLATAMTAANLWAETHQPQETCHWVLQGCFCVEDDDFELQGIHYCTFNDCYSTIPPNCQPN